MRLGQGYGRLELGPLILLTRLHFDKFCQQLRRLDESCHCRPLRVEAEAGLPLLLGGDAQVSNVGFHGVERSLGKSTPGLADFTAFKRARLINVINSSARSIFVPTPVFMLPAPTSYIPYYRVSTARQGQSGLGLDAQRAAVAAFVGDPVQLLGEFVEIESGKKNQRPQLLAAIAAARAVGATLLIAKLDRLSRNAGFIFALRDSGVNFVCCDMPDANTLTVGLFAVIAQHEREMISKRTIDALAAKKARGVVLGTPANMTSAAIAKSLNIRQENARTNQQNQQAARLAGLLYAQGHKLQQIAQELNEGGYRTRRGKLFFPMSVQRLLKRRVIPTAANEQ